ncbi:hypothetical protein [Pseudonocardia sp. GCM10023141]|uniref:hypothetical protein n=1 Tax=Pseudonocardia sp. GCM10023141 TaxID=3252653 RepID=UPI00361A9DA0
MAGDRPVLLGLLLYVFVAATPTLLFWLALRLLPAALDALQDRRTARRQPPGPSLETVVADLRRLRREVRAARQPSQVRRLAVTAAYDVILLDACRLVGVDAPLADATVTDADRAFARLLTEAALEDAGVALDPPSGSTAAA